MAKSLRSKPKLRAKSIKRKGEFTKFVDDRNSRLADKVRANLEQQKGEKKAEEEAKMEDKIEEDKKDSKVATSGWRGNSRQRMKAKRSKRKSTKF